MSQHDSSLAHAIRRARKAFGMSQDQLADAIGVHRPAVSNWERGIHEPTARNLEDIARVLGTTADALRAGVADYQVISKGGTRSDVRPARTPLRAPRIPPRAYQLVYEYCGLLEAAQVPEEQVEEARRLMSGVTFNTLHAGLGDERTEEDWVKDVKAAWAFIKDTLIKQGFEL